MKNPFSKTFVALTISITAFAGIAKGQKTPNIVFILADDLGYGSINSYGAGNSLVRTPHIDGLAEQGMRFTNASTPASICTPTRYGLLTGRYPWRTSLKFGVVNPTGSMLPHPDRVTVADLLKELGYNTAAIGKWHLGYGQNEPVDFTEKLDPSPLDLGFDYHFGVPQNHGEPLGVYIENDHIYGLRSKKTQPYSRTFYGAPYHGYDAPQRVNKDVMEELTNKSVDWLKQQSKDTPFFLYFAPVAVHHPITPSDHMRGLSDCGPYGDFIQDLDVSVGKIFETLKYMNLLENTIVIFTSDNGGDIPGNRPEAPEMQAIDYGLKINGDLRGDKHTIFEGGTRVPFIVYWPGKVEEGSVSDDLINMVDVFATVSEITKGTLPESNNIAPDSYSFFSALMNAKNQHPRTSMVTADMNGMQAVRLGDWKYIDDTPPEGLPDNRLNHIRNSFKPQLYNLADDPAEEVNLFDERPDMVKKLSNELSRIKNTEPTR
jgi:arylsulfatase A